MPVITDEFNSFKDVGWYSSVYFMTNAIAQLLNGRLYTRYPIKYLYTAAMLFFLVGSFLVLYQGPELHALIDDDVAEGVAALASTFETSSRGVIYEHPAQTLTGQKLANELKATLEEIKKHGARVFDHEAAVTLRAIEQGAREAAARVAGGNGTEYLALMRRLLEVGSAALQKPASAPSSLILPP